MYNSKAAAKDGIASVKANASGATIDDQTGEWARDLNVVVRYTTTPIHRVGAS
jgi:hypothetical protein